MGPSAYLLDDLGWYQFERVCSLILEAETGLSEIHWLDLSDVARVARIEQPLTLRTQGIALTGPVSVAIVWIPEHESEPARLEALVDRLGIIDRLASLLGELERQPAGRLLLMTNLDGVDASARLATHPLAQALSVTVLGGAELSASLDGNPSVRAAMPSVLGLRDLRPLIADDTLGRSTFDLERAQGLARVFWPTEPYERARVVLAQHRFVVLTGPPEMGKTAIAQMLALTKITDGWEAHDCNAPEQLWRVFDAARRQVFVADDAFGSTEYRPDTAERWAGALGRLLPMLDDHHWLIWTSRPAPLKAGLSRVQREPGAGRFPAPGQVLVDASHLDLAEKTLILFRHVKQRAPSRAARDRIRTSGLVFVEDPHFTPERIRRFVADRIETLVELSSQAKVWAAVEHELASPTEAMRTSYRALDDEHRELLRAMLDTPDGLVDERGLVAAVRRHRTDGFSRPPAQVIDRLTDHFLRVSSAGIGWVHPSWRDLVIDELRDDKAARRDFLRCCEVPGLTLALSREGGATGERSFPLLVDDQDWDLLGDRLAQLLGELEHNELARVLLTLREALEGDLGRQYDEAHALARYTLTSTAGLWNRRQEVLPVFLLEAWFSLNRRKERPVEPPLLARTWAELHPGTLEARELTRAELIRTDEWLALAQILARHTSAQLRKLGFFGADQEVIHRLVEAVRRSSNVDTRPIVSSILIRVAEVAPHHFDAAVNSIVWLRETEPQWWAPSDLPAPPSTELVDPDNEDFSRLDVTRVLSDL